MAAISHETTYIRSIQVRIGEFGKRLFDIFISAMGLMILSPAFAVVALYIKRTSPGPVFYRGPRVGRWGKIFDILKFSTMRDSLESKDSPRITAKNDPRVTPGGRWLRDTKLNEIPQLWNVLKGEMSLVGPRPEDPEIVATWAENERHEILSVRPGITSPASIFFRDEERLLQTASVMEKYMSSIVPSKIRLDQIYVKDHNLLGDLDILFLTVIALLPGLRDRPIPEHLLTWGPLARLFSRHLNLFLIDVPIAFAAVGISGFLWRTAGPLNLGWGPAILLAVVIALLFGVVNALLGMNRIAWSHARPSDALGLAVSGVFTALLLIAFNWLSPGWVNLPIGMWAMICILAFAGSLVARYRLRLLTGLATLWLQWRGTSTHLGERVLIVGAGDMAQFAAQLVRQSNSGKVLNIIGMVDDDSRKQDMRFDGNKVIGTTEDIPQLVSRWNVGVILFAIGSILPEKRKAILDCCRQTTARLVLIPNLFEILSGFLFASSALLADNVFTPDKDGRIPVSELVEWLAELETLSCQDNDQLLARLRQARNALAAYLVNDPSRIGD